MPARESTPSREATPRVSIAQVRGQLAPRVYRAMRSVRLEHEGVACEVTLTEIAGHGTVRNPQRRLVCPRCTGAVLVLGVVAGAWVCAGCGKGRSRERSRSVQHPTRVDPAGGSGARGAGGSAAPAQPAEVAGDREERRVALAAALHKYWEGVGAARRDDPGLGAGEVGAELAPRDDADHRGAVHPVDLRRGEDQADEVAHVGGGSEEHGQHQHEFMSVASGVLAEAGVGGGG